MAKGADHCDCNNGPRSAFMKSFSLLMVVSCGLFFFISADFGLAAPLLMAPHNDNDYAVELNNYFPVVKNRAIRAILHGFVTPPGDRLSFKITSEPTKGQADLGLSGEFHYTPAPDAVGWDHFSVNISNSAGSTEMPVSLFISPDVDELHNLLTANPTAAGHPRLLLTDSDLENVRKMIRLEPFVEDASHSVIQSADKTLALPPLDLSEGALRGNTKPANLINLCMAYRLTSDKKYLVKLEALLHSICDSKLCPNWSDGASLDAAEISHQVSISYDWLYHELSDSQRKEIRQAIARNGIVKFVDDFHQKDKQPEAVRYADNNWVFVCNSGKIQSALALWDEPADDQYDYPVLCQEIMRNYFKYMPAGFLRFNPGGGWFEGPGYAAWMIRVFTYADKSIEICFGKDFGLINAPGFSNAGDFLAYDSGPRGWFGYGDSSTSSPKQDAHTDCLWFSETFRGQMMHGPTSTPQRKREAERISIRCSGSTSLFIEK